MKLTTLFPACRILTVAATLAAMFVLNAAQSFGQEYLSGVVWPEPPKVTPGKNGAPPSDAIVLFDGTNLDAWEGGDRWLVEEGVATVRRSSIQTKQSFGDMQLHVEWAAPAEVRGNGQGRGNSGIYIMGKYEVQVLDSYGNETYFDGQAASIYKQTPPMVNASLPPGEWQTYDIIFEAPRFSDAGEVLKPAYLTVIHNGVLVQNHFELTGGTFWEEPAHYEPHAAKLPITLQDHGNPVRYRNIWLREYKQLLGTKPAADGN